MNKHSRLPLISALLLSATLAGCGGSSGGGSNDPEDGPSGETGGNTTDTVSGLVRNYYTGEPVSAASLTLSSPELEESIREVADEQGLFSLEALAGLANVTITARAQGYGTNAILTSTTEGADNDSLELSLMPAQLTEEFDSTQEATLSVGGINVTDLPANAFRTATGEPYNGTINTQVTILDPSSDPGIIPGIYEVQDETGAQQNMVSYGAVTYDFADDQGNLLQLQDGRPATVRIPLAGGLNWQNAPTSLPLAWFNEQIGQWVVEGEATLSGTGNYYEGQVSHFTTWNVVDTYEPTLVTGLVTNQDGEPVPNARITAQGASYNGFSTATTAADGTFSIEARPESQVLISAAQGTSSNTREVNVGADGANLANPLVISPAAVTIKLTWGENPRDLDSHLLGPADELGTEEFHVAFWNKTEAVGDTVIELDVDDVTSFGPEIVTIPEFPYPGRYRYLVHLYSGTGTIEDSPARVEFNINNETRIFSPANAQGTTSDWWAVADIVVDEAGGTRLETVQEWRAEREDMAVGWSFTPENPATTAAKRKFYAE